LFTLVVMTTVLAFSLARADTILSTFDNFNLDGTFASWASAVIVSDCV
jgi:hypothetical protein